MKAKNKIILGSALAIAMSASMIAGSTFALFTSESTVNIAVTSGKVNVTAQIGELTTYSLDVEQEGGKFANGGFASAVAGEVTLEKISAGDKVKIPVTVVNESTISILYRTKVEVSESDLTGGLEVSVDNNGSYLGVKSYISAWKSWSEDDSVIDVMVGLPKTAGNEYAGVEVPANLKVTVEAIQANGAIKGSGKYVKTIENTYVSEGTDFKDAVANGENTVLLADIDLEGEPATYTQSATLDLNGHTVTATGREPDIGWGVISATGVGTMLTINGGTGMVDGLGMTYPIAVEAYDGATIIVNGGTFIGGEENACLYVNGKTVDTTIIVHGGYFKTGLFRGDHCIINIRDNAVSHAIVYGGTFENYNPAWGDQTMNKDIYGKDENEAGEFIATKGGFVAEGYHVDKEVVDEQTTLYRVVKD